MIISNEQFIQNLKELYQRINNGLSGSSATFEYEKQNMVAYATEYLDKTKWTGVNKNR